MNKNNNKKNNNLVSQAQTLIDKNLWHTYLKVTTSSQHPPHLIKTTLVNEHDEPFDSDIPFTVTPVSDEYYRLKDQVASLTEENKLLKTKIQKLKELI
jgi:hypothetical protein